MEVMIKRIFDVISKAVPNSAMVEGSQLPERDRCGLAYFVMEFATSEK
jgi:hypothetical protein